MFSFLFGKKEKKVAAAIATDDLHLHESDLQKKLNALERIRETHHTNAVEQKRKGNTNSALHFLKREKMVEEEIASVNNMLLLLCRQRMEIKQAKLQNASLLSLKQATETMKRDAMHPDAVATLMDDIEDTRASVREINDLIRQANRDNTGDAELLAELEAETRITTTPATSAARVPEMPAAPSTAIEASMSAKLAALETA